jgi:hypothetical protein
MRRLLLAIAIFALLPWFCQPGLAQAAGKDNQTPSLIQKVPLVDASAFVGCETCATCLADLVTKLTFNPYAQLALTHSGTGTACDRDHIQTRPGLHRVDESILNRPGNSETAEGVLSVFGWRA